MSARMASRPRQVTVWFRGIPYTLDLVRCRRALVGRQVDGELDSMESLANMVGISRSTASRFFSGKCGSWCVLWERSRVRMSHACRQIGDSSDVGLTADWTAIEAAPGVRHEAV